MRMLLVLIFSALSHVSCSTPIKDPARKSADGLARLHEFDVIRAEDRKVISDLTQAHERLKQIKTVQAFYGNQISGDCGLSDVFEAKEGELRALDHIKAGNFESALGFLDVADKLCDELRYRTGREYYRAVAFAKLGRMEEAKAAAQWFLDYADNVMPDIYEQGNEHTEKELRESLRADLNLLGAYRAQALAFIQNGTPPEIDSTKPTDSISKFVRKNFFSPGGNEMEGAALFPYFAYSTFTGFTVGAAAYKSWGVHGLGVLAIYGGDAGLYWGVRLRRSLYESPNRNFNWDVYATAQTAKELTYIRESSGVPITKVRVERERIFPGLGTGATYRFTPRWGLSGEAIYFNDTFNLNDRFLGSFYGNYYLFSSAGFVGGWILNRPVVGIEFMFLQFGYDFNDKGIVFLIQGMRF